MNNYIKAKVAVTLLATVCSASFGDGKSKSDTIAALVSQQFRLLQAGETPHEGEAKQTKPDFLNMGAMDLFAPKAGEGLDQSEAIKDRDLYEVLGQEILPQSTWQSGYLVQDLGILRPSGWSDLALIAQATNTTSTLGLTSILATPKTLVGSMQLGTLLVTPLMDIAKLQSRQRVLRTLVDDSSLRREITSLLNRNAAAVKAFIRLWSTMDEAHPQNRGMAHLRIHASFGLSKNRWGVETFQIFMHHLIPLSPALSSIVKARDKPFIPEVLISTGMSVIFHQFMNQLIGKVAKFDLDRLKMRLRNFAQLVDTFRQLDKILVSHGVLVKEMEDERSALVSFTHSDNPGLSRLLRLIKHPSIYSDSYFSAQGPTYEAFFLLAELKQEFADALMAMGKIDAMTAVADRIADNLKTPRAAPISFASYLAGESTPKIRLRRFWNPFLPTTKAVVNDLNIGGEDSFRVGIINGPNAGGKSTAMKAVALNIVLAQTFGISFSEKMELTPFRNLTTYMNISDDLLQGNSTFKAELLRARSYLNILKGLPSGEFSFAVLDEIFSGTNPEEGAAAGYSFVHHIGKNPQSLALVATHYSQIAQLPAADPRWFANLQVRVPSAADGRLMPDFRLHPGVSHQKVAIALLRQEGFDSEILEEAESLLGRK